MQLTKSIIWAIHDKEKFGFLVAALTKLIEDLKEFTKNSASSNSSGVLARGRWQALKERIVSKLPHNKSRLRLKGNNRSQLLLGGTDPLEPGRIMALNSRPYPVLQCQDLRK